MIAKKFIGHWNLVKMCSVSENGDEILPLGANVRGLLHYSEGGIMSAQLGNAFRANFYDNDFRMGTDVEIREAFNGYISYFGKYLIIEDKGFIIHDVEMSMFPNWIGTKVKRYYEFSDDLLTLKATPIEYEGVLRTPTLIWQKI